MFSEAGWISAFLGLGIVAADIDVLAKQHDAAQLEQIVSRIEALMSAAVSAMPPPMDYIAQFAKSS